MTKVPKPLGTKKKLFKTKGKKKNTKNKMFKCFYIFSIINQNKKKNKVRTMNINKLLRFSIIQNNKKKTYCF